MPQSFDVWTIIIIITSSNIRHEKLYHSFFLGDLIFYGTVFTVDRGNRGSVDKPLPRPFVWGNSIQAHEPYYAAKRFRCSDGYNNVKSNRGDKGDSPTYYFRFADCHLNFSRDPHANNFTEYSSRPPDNNVFILFRDKLSHDARSLYAKLREIRFPRRHVHIYIERERESRIILSRERRFETLNAHVQNIVVYFKHFFAMSSLLWTILICFYSLVISPPPSPLTWPRKFTSVILYPLSKTVVTPIWLSPPGEISLVNFYPRKNFTR